MASIPGWVYIISGIVISAFAQYVRSRVNTSSLSLFFIAGIIFIVIGISKIMFGYVKRKKDPYLAKSNNNNVHLQQNQGTAAKGFGNINRTGQNISSSPYGDHTRTHHITRVPTPQSPQHQSIIIACPQCGARHYNFANFCMNCGTNLK